MTTPKDAVSTADFVSSDGPYLCALQIASLPGQRVRGVIERVSREEVQMPGSSKTEPRYVIWIRGWKKRVVVGSRRSRKWLTALLGGTDTSAWKGQSIWIYYDPTVRFGKTVTGGIRFARGTSYSGDVAPAGPTPADDASPSTDPSDAPGEPIQAREPGGEG
jgi:hypothetical protein